MTIVSAVVPSGTLPMVLLTTLMVPPALLDT